MGIKRPGREDDHSPPLVLRSIMRGAIPPLPQYDFVAWSSDKTQEQLYVYFYHAQNERIYSHLVVLNLIPRG